MRTALLLIATLAVAACSPAATPPPAGSTPSNAPPPAPSLSSSATAKAASVTGDRPPVAPTREARDEYFGKVVIDPYRWMETDSPEYAAWMKGQSEYTRRTLDALGTRAALLDRIRALDNAGPRVRAIGVRRDKVFSMEAESGSETYKLFVRVGIDGKKRALLDPDALKTDDKSVSIDYWSVSPDARHVAYGLSKAGSEMAVLHVVETETGKILSDVIDRARYAGPSWRDDRSFFYKRDRKLPDDAPANERFTRARVHLHVLGQDPEKDEAVFGYGVSPGITITDEAFPEVMSSAASNHLIAVVYHGVQKELSIWSAPKKAFAGAKTPWKMIAQPGDEITDYDVRGDDIYLLSHKGAPRSKLLRMSLKAPDLTKAQTIIPESEAVITRTGLAKDALYVRKLDGGIGRVFRVPFDTNKPEALEIGVSGSANALSVDDSVPGALIRVESWIASPRVVAWSPAKKRAEPTEIIPRSPVAFDGIVATEVKAKSADGTLVPLSILHKKDLPRDGANPTYLNGYGSYGNVYGPFFEPMDLAWLERGGVIAACHVRGGGEYGEDWHNAGKLATKPNTISDFIGCAEYLVQEKYTSPARLAGQGTSAGGILIGGAIVRRPDLFGAAVIRVGMVNALRFEQIPIGPFNTSEFGSVATKEGFEMLWAIDAYHAVEKGKPYPAVLLTTGITDPRVSPWQMAKMAARLQASTGSETPVLLRVDYGAGHGVGTAKSKYEEEVADIYTFLSWRIGTK